MKSFFFILGIINYVLLIIYCLINSEYGLLTLGNMCVMLLCAILLNDSEE
jgi:hypothetical protein